MKRNILHFLQSIRWTRRRILKMLGCLILLFALVECYSIWFSRTKIAFVNFQPIALQGFSQANDNPMISLSDVSTKDMEELDAYDIVFINGMGLNITAEQRAYVKQLAESGKPIYTTMATNPDNNISNLTTEELALVKKYMMFGGKKNHRSLLSFIRHNIDGKIIFTGTALKPQIKPSDYLYYPSTDNNDEEQEFLTVKDYELFLRQHNLWHEGAQKVIVSGQITDPSDLILALAQTGKYNVYPVASTTKLQEFAEQIQPAAIINLAHGRLGDDMVEWLKRTNTLLFDPLTINDLRENYAEEITHEKVTGTPYTMGQAYADEDIHTSVLAMTTDPIAYCRYQLDRMKGRVGQLSKAAFSDRYLAQAKQTVERLYANPTMVTDATICSLAGISLAELQKSREVMEWKNAPKGMLAMMMAAKKHSKDSASAGKGGMADMMKQMAQSTDDVPPAKNNPIAKFMRHQMRKMLAKGDPSQMMEVARKMGASEEALKKMSAAMGKKANGGMGMMGNTSAPKYSRQEIALAEAISQVETALKNVGTYRQLLHDSPTAEFAAISNALCGGYTPPSPGGDPIVNPNTLPTGRNLFAINAEETPSEDAWDKGVALAKATLADYQRTHKGAYPRKVSYTLWSGEFIQTGGATIAQVLYLLGVEPVRDRYGRVNDLKLIPSKELGRPRIDVVVQTSGQLRDLAASRLFLINRAVEMAASAADDAFSNMVKDGVEESERYLIDKGVPPAEARSMSKYRVFGGVQGGYGTGIQSMVEKGDAWDDDRQIAEQYIHNMGAFYGDQEHWEAYADDAFGAALTRTDVVMQPRQNNSWGALSLDHVYEFMGGMNLAVRKVTGKDPEAYFADYRNRNNYRVQDSKEAIAVEARTKLFNEQYVKESLKGGATSTDALAEMVRNTYGWNVMKPAAINKDMWNEIYDVYVKDKFHLGVHEKMGATNPAAMQEITATMMETARKGYWKASPEQLREIAKVHTAFTRKYGASGSSFEGANSKLQDFIAKQSSASDAKAYKDNLRKQSHTLADSKQQAMVMKKQTTQSAEEMERTGFNGIYVVGIVLVLFIAFAVIIRQKRKKL